ncbi:2770_t:CDS:2 [Ambispora leptoticha]|uniref:2770_t:CDS:1 n=1 Tax=Ambispora leptoticha TaxID=144679 RepID=A0A9N9FTU9_9GLOM|nr:2770_t:CDS:2 [Ambispora leptoticha]
MEGKPQQLQQQQQQCGHPKHEEYISSIKEIGKRKAPLKRKLVKVPKRMYQAIGIKDDTLICSRCIVQTDKDPQYLNHPKFVNQRVKTRQNVASMLRIDMVDYPRKGEEEEEETLPPPAKKLKKSSSSSKSSKTEEVEESQRKGKERKNGKASSSGTNLKTFKSSKTNKNS